VATTWKAQEQAWEVDKNLIRKQHLFRWRLERACVASNGRVLILTWSFRRWMLQPGEWQKIDSYSGHPLPPKEYFEPVKE